MKKILILLILFMCYNSCLEANPLITRNQTLSSDPKFQEKFTFVNMDFTNSMVEEYVNFSFKSSEGKMWLGTPYGLYLYDSNAVKHKSISRVANSIKWPHDFNIRTITEDASHNLWLVTYDSLVVWSPITEQPVDLDYSGIQKKHPFRYLKGCTIGADGNIWLYGFDIIYCYNQETKKMTDYSYLLGGNKSTIYCMLLDRQNRFWVVSNNQIYLLKKQKAALDVDESSYVLKKFALFDDKSFDRVTAIFQDSEDALWLLSINKILRVELDESAQNMKSLERIHFADSSILINCDLVEYNRNIYLFTSAGLMRYTLSDRSCGLCSVSGFHLERNGFMPLFPKLYVDKEQTMWLSTYKGVYQHNVNASHINKYENIKNRLDDTSVMALTQDIHKNLWFVLGWGGGILRWNYQTDEIESVKPLPNHAFNSDNVTNALAMGNELFFGSSRPAIQPRLYRMDMTTREVTYVSIPTMDTGDFNVVNSMVARDEKSIWLGLTSGLCLFHIETNQLTQFPSINQRVNFIYKDESYVWVLTDKGLYRLSLYGELDDFTELSSLIEPQGNFRPDLLTTVDNQLYMASQEGGLYRGIYKTDTIGTFECVEAFNGVSIRSMVVCDGILWLATNNGLYSLDPITDQIRFFNTRDGLNNRLFLPEIGLATEDGMIVLGGKNGITCFRPSALNYNTVRPKAVLTDLYVGNKLATVGGEDSPLTKTLSYTDRLILHERDHNVGIGFSSSSYRNTSKNVFQYRLDPLNREWVNANGSHFAYYNDLQPGTYVFRVRTHNGEGEWSEEKTFQLTVVPYWWRSLPMKIVYVLGLIGCVALFFYRYNYKKRMQKKQQMIEFQREQELYETKMSFFTCMVHEIRTPLTLIMGPLSSLLKDKVTAQNFGTELEVMNRNSHRLLQLVNRLMDFMKIEEKAYTIQLATVDIREMVDQFVSDFKLMNTKRHLSINVSLPDSPCWAWVEREAFNKVCLNLLSNACKFAQSTVSVSLNASDDGEKWELTVTDDGCGISPEHQTRIFESFYQVDENQPSDLKGTGIGLFVVRRLVKMQQGTISLVSELGKGASFKVSFAKMETPESLQAVNSEQYAEQNGSKEPGDETDVESPIKRLLVVEDNMDMQNYISSIFSDHMAVDVCENGEEALRKVTETEYNLILTDLMMPVMDGMTLLRTLKSNLATCHIPVVILSAKVDDKSQVEGLEEKAEAYLTKPFTSEVLFSQVVSILKNREILCERFSKEAEVVSTDLCLNIKDQKLISAVDEYIYAHLTNVDLSVDEVASEVGLGRSIFYRKIHAITGLTPNDYIRTFRLKKALELLKSGEYRISEVCYYVGFSSPSYFTKRFAAQFGFTPSELLKNM